MTIDQKIEDFFKRKALELECNDIEGKEWVIVVSKKEFEMISQSGLLMPLPTKLTSKMKGIKNKCSKSGVINNGIKYIVILN